MFGLPCVVCCVLGVVCGSSLHVLDCCVSLCVVCCVLGVLLVIVACGLSCVVRGVLFVVVIYIYVLCVVRCSLFVYCWFVVVRRLMIVAFRVLFSVDCCGFVVFDLLLVACCLCVLRC